MRVLQQKQLGASGQHACHREQLLFAVGQLRTSSRAAIGQADMVQDRQCSALRRRCVLAAWNGRKMHRVFLGELTIDSDQHIVERRSGQQQAQVLEVRAMPWRTIACGLSHQRVCRDTRHFQCRDAGSR